MQPSLDDIKTWAVVRAIDSDGRLRLDVSESQASSCHTGGCGANGLGCQSNAFARLLTRPPALTLKLPATESVSVGDALLLSLSQQALVKFSLMAYGVPLLALLVGMALGQILADDWGALCLGSLWLLSSWYLVGKLSMDAKPQVHDIQRFSR